MRNSMVFPVLFFMIIFGFGGMFSGLLFPLIIFFIIYKSVTKNNEGRETVRRRSSSGQSRTRLSGRQSDLVNEALAAIFARMKSCRCWKKSACGRKKRNIPDCAI